MAGVERFSRMAKQYDGNKSPTLDPTVDAVRRLHWWPTEPSLRAMELGCGTGQLSFALLDSLSSVTGVDPAQGMIDVLSEKIEESELGERMSAVCANLLEEQPEGLPLGSFDVIFSKLAFHHIPDCGAMVKAVAPYLAPGGRLLILVRAALSPSPSLSRSLSLSLSLSVCLSPLSRAVSLNFHP